MKKYKILLLITSLLILSGCNTTPKKEIRSQEIDPNGVLNFRLSGEPTLLNPILSTDAYSSNVEGLIYRGLFRTNTDLEMEPDLCERYTISDDGKTYTFYLKKNIKWHDGAPFTAHDVKFTFDTIMNPKTNTVRRSGYIINGKPIQFKVINELTIEAILPEPFAPFLIRSAMGIIPKHIFEKEDINTTPLNRKPIGTGPFIFEEWKTGQYIKLSVNPNYDGDQPKLKTIFFKMIPDTNTALVALEKGEIDEVGIPPKDYEKMKKNQNLNLFTIESLAYSYMGFNLKKPLFENPKSRQAIVHAINRNAIIKGVLKGFGKPAHLPSSPVLWSYPEEGELITYNYNPKKSKLLLKELGYKLNDKTKILEKDGRPFEFTLITSKGSQNGEKIAQILQRFLLNVGIKMNIQLMEWQSFIKILNAPESPKNFDTAMLSWSLGIDPDSYSIWHSTQHPKGFNFIGYKNDLVDQLLIDGRRETNKEKRKPIYQKLYNTIAKDAPYLFLVYPESISAVNKRVKGLSKPGPAGLFNKIEDIYVVK